MSDNGLVTVHQEAAFNIEYEQYGPVKVMHSQVARWTPTVARRYRQTAQRVFEELREPLFIAVFLPWLEDRTHQHFIRWLGFVPCQRGEYRGNPCIYYVKVK
ncbi:MAG: hypothetical protein J7D61_07750 [Marichromatium sp.]|nr:hypothetical protein [Marichromatium sp.]